MEREEKEEEEEKEKEEKRTMREKGKGNDMGTLEKNRGFCRIKLDFFPQPPTSGTKVAFATNSIE